MDELSAANTQNARLVLTLIESITENNQKLRSMYPCKNCEGTGENYNGQFFTPCEECWGRGWNVPNSVMEKIHYSIQWGNKHLKENI